MRQKRKKSGGQKQAKSPVASGVEWQDMGYSQFVREDLKASKLAVLFWRMDRHSIGESIG
jgi:hypothetical protein